MLIGFEVNISIPELKRGIRNELARDSLCSSLEVVTPQAKPTCRGIFISLYSLNNSEPNTSIVIIKSNPWWLLLDSELRNQSIELNEKLVMRFGGKLL